MYRFRWVLVDMYRLSIGGSRVMYRVWWLFVAIYSMYGWVWVIYRCYRALLVLYSLDRSVLAIYRFGRVGTCDILRVAGVSTGARFHCEYCFGCWATRSQNAWGSPW
jgi:hypothetical protein